MSRSVPRIAKPAPANSAPLCRRDFIGALGSAVVTRLPRTPAERERLPDHSGGLLNEIEKRAVRFFYEQADQRTGLVRDRVRTAGIDTRRVASIAATGFGLSAMCIGDRHGYLPRGEAKRRTARTLEFLLSTANQQHGFYWHFLDMTNGQRALNSEISSIDTAWLLCGVLHARAHFADASISRMAQTIIDRVDWRWMLNGGELLSHGWTPERGFLPYRWDSYSELLAMYLLANGS